MSALLFLSKAPEFVSQTFASALKSHADRKVCLECSLGTRMKRSSVEAITPRQDSEPVYGRRTSSTRNDLRENLRLGISTSIAHFARIGECFSQGIRRVE